MLIESENTSVAALQNLSNTETRTDSGLFSNILEEALETESEQQALPASTILPTQAEQVAISAEALPSESANSSASMEAVPEEKPCIAQFMVMTGCDFSTASAALYQYGNWKDYLNGSNSAIPDLSEAQRQLAAEREDGSRPMVDGTYGARADYVKPQPVEPEVPGKVLPVFNEESGTVSGLGFISAEGEQKTTASLTDIDTIYAHTDGFHIGRAALDSFARMATGEENAKFANLDLAGLAQNFPSMQQWIARNGENSTWNHFTAENLLGEESELEPASTDSSSLIQESELVPSELGPLYAQAQMNSLLFSEF